MILKIEQKHIDKAVQNAERHDFIIVCGCIMYEALHEVDSEIKFIGGGEARSELGKTLYTFGHKAMEITGLSPILWKYVKPCEVEITKVHR